MQAGASLKCARGGGVHCGDLGWHLALTQLQWPGLAANVVPGLSWGWGESDDDSAAGRL